MSRILGIVLVLLFLTLPAYADSIAIGGGAGGGGMSSDLSCTACVSDSELVSNYPGIGVCGSNLFVTGLNDNTAPTCTQPGFSNLSGVATNAQLPVTISDKTLSKPKIKDEDATPVDDILVRVIDGVLQLRNSGDTGFRELSNSSLNSLVSLLGQTISASEVDADVATQAEIDLKANLTTLTSTQTFNGAQIVLGTLQLSTLATPSAPTVTPQGTTGSTTYGYKIVATVGGQNTGASSEGTTTTGNATLSGSNFNRITWSQITGATGYKIYRTTGAATQGLIGTVTNGSTLTFDDTGLTGDGTTAPTTNSTGKLLKADGTAFNYQEPSDVDGFWAAGLINPEHTHKTGAGAPTNPCSVTGSKYIDTNNGEGYNCRLAGQNWVKQSSLGSVFQLSDGSDTCTPSGLDLFTFQSTGSDVTANIPTGCSTKEVTWVIKNDVVTSAKIAVDTIVPADVDETQDYSFPILSGKIDRNNTAVDDDDCTGEQGKYWYDTVDLAFEFCNANSGVPTVLGGGGGGTQTVTRQMKLSTVSVSDANAFVDTIDGTNFDYSGVRFVDAQTGNAFYTFKLPPNLATTPAWNLILTHKATAGAGGNVSLFIECLDFATNVAFDAALTDLWGTAANPDEKVVNTSANTTITTISATNFDATEVITASNFLVCRISRVGADALDTVNNAWLLLDVSVRFDENS